MTIALDKSTGSSSVNQSRVKVMTLVDFLNYEDDSEAMYEFEDGELIPMAVESEINRRIAMYLLVCLIQQGISPARLSMKTEIVVTGSRLRVHDLVVFSEDLAIALEGAKRSTIMPEMPAPMLVVEVVSPNQSSRDYRYKRSEYAARDVSEYWIIDPIEQKVTVLEWVEGFYEEKVYMGGDRLVSPIFPNLDLIASQVLKGN